MRTSRKTTWGAAGAVAVLALGGTAAASATQHTARLAKPAHRHAPVSEPAGKIDKDNVQAGDQRSPDAVTHIAAVAGEAADAAIETSSENAAASDGPGGHEDPAGNVEHEGQGEE
jgi:hypothetical protein